MIEIKEKRECAGCTACATVCPKKCIEMMPDEEGFLYPHVEKSRCISCNACDAVCPIQNPVIEEKKPQNAYLVQHSDEVVRKESTAGGHSQR